jgi:phage-related protein
MRDAAGTRIIYLASGQQVVVAHAFQKKTKTTSRHDIDLAANRLRAWKG